MLNQKEIEKYADVLLWGMTTARANGFNPGDIIKITANRLAFPLLEAVYERCVKRGFNIFTVITQTPKMEKSFFTHANKNQLDWLPEWAVPRAETQNGLINIYGQEDLLNLKDIDPIRIARAQKPLKPIRDVFDKREDSGDFGWTLCLWPSEDMAKQANMTLDDMFELVKKGCFLDLEDPVAKWRELYEYGKKVTAWLKDLGMEVIHLISDNCDLTVKLGEHRQFISTSGRNIPSFEVFTSPDCRFTEGYFYANEPTFRNGNLVRGVKLGFEEGKVVKMTAEEGEEFTQSQLDIDNGAKMVGEFSLTDKRYSPISTFMANTLYDENVGQPNGNCHIAIGASFPDCYIGGEEWSEELKTKLGYNDSVLHWDLINTEPKTVTAKCKDGSEVMIYDDGMFTL